MKAVTNTLSVAEKQVQVLTAGDVPFAPFLDGRRFFDVAKTANFDFNLLEDFSMQ